MNQIIASLKGYVYGLSLPKIGVVDILEIIWFLLNMFLTKL